MKTIIDSSFPLRRVVLIPEGHGDRLQLRELIAEADKAGVRHGEERDIDNIYCGHWIALSAAGENPL